MRVETYSGLNLQMLQELVQDDPENVEAQLALGLKFLDTNELEGAHRCFAEMTRLDADNRDGWGFLGDTNFRRRNWQQAANAWERWYESSSLDPGQFGRSEQLRLVHISDCYRHQEDFESAVESGRRTLRLFPNLVEAHDVLTQLAYARNNLLPFPTPRANVRYDGMFHYPVTVKNPAGERTGELDCCCRLRLLVKNNTTFVVMAFVKAEDPGAVFDEREAASAIVQEYHLQVEHPAAMFFKHLPENAAGRRIVRLEFGNLDPSVDVKSQKFRACPMANFEFEQTTGYRLDWSNLDF